VSRVLFDARWLSPNDRAMALRKSEVSQLDTPVAMIVFNRPRQTEHVFAQIREARPSRLFLIADGPRPDRDGEFELCRKVRQIVSKVDWPCNVETNFADRNMGCRSRVVSGLNWVFSLVEEAIILEDDCLPDPTFFPYCSNLLQRYRDCSQIGMICGFNPLPKAFCFPYCYYFTRMVMVWGWATWRRTWREYDEELRTWPAVRQDRLLNLLFRERRIVKHWTNVFDAMYQGVGPNTWDYQLVYTSWTHNWLNIVPKCNLVQNVGFEADATHTPTVDPALAIGSQSIEFPLTHPPAITDWPRFNYESQDRFVAPNFTSRLRRAMRKRFPGLVYR